MQKRKDDWCLRQICTLCKLFKKLWHITWHHYLLILFCHIVPSVAEFFLILVHCLHLVLWLYVFDRRIQSLKLQQKYSLWTLPCLRPPEITSPLCKHLKTAFDDRWVPAVPLTKEYLEHNNYCLVWNPKGRSWSLGKGKMNILVKCFCSLGSLRHKP